MKLLNLCCGAVRPQGEEWVNCDDLHASLPVGTPERSNLDLEVGYHNRNIEKDGVPLNLGEFDGILFSHALEHFDCQVGVRIMTDCRRILKPGGVLIVSVPDASYFRRVYDEDTVENAQRLFGEPIHLPDGETTFFGYGLWNRWHKAILTEDALWCYFKRAGFGRVFLALYHESEGDKGFKFQPGMPVDVMDCWNRMKELLNRLPFSLVMAGIKDKL